MLEKAGLTLIIMLSKTKKVFTTHLTVLCSIASYKLFYRITWRVETLSLLFVPPTERRRNGDYYEKNNNFDLVRNYISDEADFRQIIADYKASRKESDSPFYLFNVTMQNHGGYNGKRGLVEPKITIKDSSLNDPEAEQYINLAKMSDDAFKMLVEYFKKVDEPTLIVMFGDHQPPIMNLFYSSQFGKDVEDLSPEEEANWYSTPYVIWAIYDIEETELDMSANYLSSYVMNLAGNKLTGYNKFGSGNRITTGRWNSGSYAPSLRCRPTLQNAPGATPGKSTISQSTENITASTWTMRFIRDSGLTLSAPLPPCP